MADGQGAAFDEVEMKKKMKGFGFGLVLDRTTEVVSRRRRTEQRQRRGNTALAPGGSDRSKRNCRRWVLMYYFLNSYIIVV